MYQGRYEEGLRTIREVPPESHTSMWAANVAWDLLNLGRSGEASTLIEQYLDSVPNDPGAQVTGVRAILDAKKGDARRTEEDIRKAVALGERFGHFHHTAYNIASAYALQRLPGPAVKWLRRAADDGYPCYPLFDKDPDLDNLRQDPGFMSLMAELKAQWERWVAL